MKRLIRFGMIVVAALIVLLAGGVMMAAMNPVVGGMPEGSRLERIERSPQWNGKKFVNTLDRVDGPFLAMLLEFFTGGSDHRVPAATPVATPQTPGAFAQRSETLQVTWMGHSTFLVELDGQRFLLDPVWSRRASPFSWMGPKRFFEPPVALDKFPPVDAVLISHDHYDHLDRDSIVELNKQNLRFVLPLGVGAHLEKWGVPSRKIVELDWWEELEFNGVALVCTPARHFSGRSILMTNQDSTLWSGWALLGRSQRAYYSGDTAMFPGFAEIGRRLGPFDVTMIEVGAYNQMWADVHLGPEQALEAHRAVGGKLFIPAHWGTFDLALHSWTEPIERIWHGAREGNIAVATPRPGQTVDVARPPAMIRWWPEVPWNDAEEDPIVSSGLEAYAALPGEL